MKKQWGKPMNFQKDKKASMLNRIRNELEKELPNIETFNPEAGADLRWSIISLLRVIRLLGGKGLV